MAFDAWPDVSLAEARTKRDEANAILDDLRDPAVAKKLKKGQPLEASRQTFERVAREWFATAGKREVGRHAKIGNLERHLVSREICKERRSAAMTEWHNLAA